MIVSANVKSVQCYCRIMVLKTSCNKSSKILLQIEGKNCLLLKQEFLATVFSWLKPVGSWHGVYFMGQSSNPDVAVNKNYIEIKNKLQIWL